MTDYAITFTRTARRELENLTVTLVSRILPRIEALAQNPRPPNCVKIEGMENAWRIRVGDYRVIYSIDDDNQIVDIIAVRHRSQAYRPR